MNNNSDKPTSRQAEGNSLQKSCQDLSEIGVFRLGNLYGENRGTSFAGNVWSKFYIAPCLTTMAGGMREPLIVVRT